MKILTDLRIYLILIIMLLSALLGSIIGDVERQPYFKDSWACKSQLTYEHMWPLIWLVASAELFFLVILLININKQHEQSIPSTPSTDGENL